MPFVWDIMNWVKNRMVYTIGRWGLNIVLMAAAVGLPALTGAPLTLTGFAAIAIIGTALLQGFVIWKDQRSNEDRLVQEYRGEIAAKLGIEPARVTARELHAVANSMPEAGLEGNAILYEAINHNGRRQIMRMVTSVMAAVMTFGGLLLFAGWADSAVTSLAKQYMDWLGGSNVNIVGAMLVSGIGMSSIGFGLNRIAENFLGLDRRPANYYIREIRRDISRNRLIPQEQVFGVFVAADAVLDRVIEEAYGKRYHSMNIEEQAIALRRFGEDYPIEALTRDINNRQVMPDELAFAAVGQSSGVPRAPLPEKVIEKPQKNIIDEIKEEVSKEVTTKVETGKEHLTSVQQTVGRLVGAVQEEPAANDNGRAGFVERLGGHRMADERSHVQRLKDKRESVAQEQPVRS